MELYNYWATDSSEALEHYGTPGMHWYQRRYQYEDGSLTPEGRLRYLKGDGSLTRAGKKELSRRNKILEYGQAEDFARKWHSTSTYGDKIMREGLTDDEYAKNKKTHEYWARGIYNYIHEHYKTKLSDINDTSYKQYEHLWDTTALNDKFGNNPVTQSKKDIITKYLTYDVTKLPDSKKPGSITSIKGIDKEEAARYGLMTAGLDSKDAKRYASLWNSLKNNDKTRGMDLIDMALNVDGDDPRYAGLAKDIDEIINLHNKAYHNVYG